ncbi:hypothetical protein [Chlorobium phaeobacteroides]|uniref:Uncharacterized protein n=1 Tax=Chlorobium phaeobacteroides (strain DSM 266 / SMG 266 / 2430) TaxID=290317 RepID=A1BIJ0_CHLPD|nr:hypothetical protein [Chlorobium phaeobacteroides]ABL66217.1 hypothetical protein Cpha266_2219 [Chlorobium phaeobacteroides DSM 266]
MMKLVKMAMLVAVMVGTGTVVQATQPPSAEYGSKTDYRPDDVKEIDEKVASITREFFVDLENDYGIKLNPKQESLVASRIENVLKGIEIGNLERGLRLVRIPEDQIKSIIAEFQKKIPSFRKYLDQKGQEIMMAYRDTKEEELKIDKRLQELEAQEEKLLKEIAGLKAKLADDKAKLADDKAKLADDKAKLADDKAKLADDKAKLADDKAKLADDKAKLAENEELHMVLQETQMILQRLIQQEEQLKKEKQRGMKRRS